MTLFWACRGKATLTFILSDLLDIWPRFLALALCLTQTIWVQTFTCIFNVPDSTFCGTMKCPQMLSFSSGVLRGASLLIIAKNKINCQKYVSFYNCLGTKLVLVFLQLIAKGTISNMNVQCTFTTWVQGSQYAFYYGLYPMIESNYGKGHQGKKE